MSQSLMSLLTGAIVGVIFGLLKLPVPAPNALAGIMGIIGIFVGYMLVTK